MNRQSNLFQEISIEAIRDIFVGALGEKTIWAASLLGGGMFNTTYLVEYGALHKKAVLRLGPVNRHLLMGFEENLMAAEVYTYSVCQRLGIPCSQVLACDTSKQVVDRDFMLVEYIPSIAMVNAPLAEGKRKELYREMGAYLARLHQVIGGSFGFLSRFCAGQRFETWGGALIFEVEDITSRLERLGGWQPQEAEAMRDIFYRSRGLLDEISTPHLLHTDLWEGNVLLDRDTLEIVAIIDSDRAVWGDEAFEFASPWMENPALKEGYASFRREPAPAHDGARRRLYRMFYCLLEAYVGYGEYNQPELYETRKTQLLRLINAI